MYKQQAALKIGSVNKQVRGRAPLLHDPRGTIGDDSLLTSRCTQVTVRRACACFYYWKSVITDKKYFADATAAGERRDLDHATLAMRPWPCPDRRPSGPVDIYIPLAHIYDPC